MSKNENTEAMDWVENAIKCYTDINCAVSYHHVVADLKRLKTILTKKP